MLEDFRDRGKKLFSEEKYEEAIRIYKECVKLHENSILKSDLSLIYCNISTCFFKIGRNEKVIKYTTKSLFLDPSNQKALFRRALAYERILDFENSIKDLQTLIKTNSDIIYTEKAREVFEKYEKLKEKHSDHVEILRNLLEDFHNANSDNLNKKLLSVSHEINMHKIQIPTEIFFKIFNLIQNRINEKFLYHILELLCKKNIKNIEIVDDIMINLFDKNYQIQEDEGAEVLADHIEFYVISYVNENPVPPRNETFNVRNAYHENFKTFLLQHKYITKLIITLLEYIKSKNNLLCISLIYKLLDLDQNLAIYFLNFKIINILLYFNISTGFGDSKYWENYDDNLRISSIVSGCLQSLYSASKFEKKKSNIYFDTIISILEDCYKNDSFMYIFMFFSIMHLELEAQSFLLVECPNSFGVKLFEKVQDFFIFGVKNFFDSCHENVLPFFADYVINLMNCTKLKIDEKVKPVLKSVLDCAYYHTSYKIQILGLLAHTKYFLKDQKDLVSFNSCYEKSRKIIIDQKKNLTCIRIVEVFSFLTLNADIKERLANDKELLDTLYETTIHLCEVIKKSKTQNMNIENYQHLPSLFCFLSIHSNLISIKHHQKMIDSEEDYSESRKQLKKLALKTGQPLPEKHSKDKKKFVTARIKKISTPKFFSTLSLIVDCLRCSPHQNLQDKNMLSKYSPYYVASIYLKTLEDYEFRGIASQNGAIKSLLVLCSGLQISVQPPTNGPAYMEYPYIAANALSLIAIAIDPKICFNNQTMKDSIQPLLCNCDFRFHNKRRFEALLALTNIASVNDTVRNYFNQLPNFFHIIETAIFDSNAMVKRAAVELTTNLLMSQDFVNNFYAPEKYFSLEIERNEECCKKIERIKVFVLMTGETEEKELSRAAAGGIAMLTHYNVICDYLDSFDVFYDIMNELLESNDSEYIYRALYIILNMLNCSLYLNIKKMLSKNIFDLKNIIGSDSDFGKSKFIYDEVIKILD